MRAALLRRAIATGPPISATEPAATGILVEAERWSPEPHAEAVESVPRGEWYARERDRGGGPSGQTVLPMRPQAHGPLRRTGQALAGALCIPVVYDFPRPPNERRGARARRSCGRCFPPRPEAHARAPQSGRRHQSRVTSPNVTSSTRRDLVPSIPDRATRMFEWTALFKVRSRTDAFAAAFSSRLAAALDLRAVAIRDESL